MSKSDTQVLDFQKICRLCLVEKRSMSSIFSKKKSDKKVPLPIRIMTCASLELYEGDGLPASICSRCLTSVNQSFAFREQCEQADSTLRQYAQQMNNETSTTSVEDDGSSSAVAQAKTSVTGEASTCVGSSASLHFLADSRLYTLRRKKTTSFDDDIKEEKIKVESPEERIFDQNAEQVENYLDCYLSHGADESQPYCEPSDIVVESLHNELNLPVAYKVEKSRKLTEVNPLETLETKEKCKAMGCEPKKRGVKSRDVDCDTKSKYKVCDECSKIVLKKNYALHLRVHSVVMPHMCDICGRCFKWRRVMEGHKRTHTGEKPYLCNTCGKRFTSSSRLSDHSTIHTGRRSYVCELCANSFRDKKHLTRHLRTHSGEKPFKCSFCGRGFSNKWNLKEHTRRHTGDLPHVCPVCSQGFNRNKGLEEHIKSKHENFDWTKHVPGSSNRLPVEKTEMKPVLHDCPICSIGFVNKESLIEHLKLHKNVAEFETEHDFEVIHLPFLLK